jgi:hypothetical protein
MMILKKEMTDDPTCGITCGKYDLKYLLCLLGWGVCRLMTGFMQPQKGSIAFVEKMFVVVL